jgi:uncharacterized Tic20 family protein
METTQNEKNNAMLVHLSSFGSLVIPLGSLILPIILWQAMKKDSNYIDFHGKQAVNFNISFFIYNIIAIILFFGSSLGAIINVALEADNATNIQDISGTLFSIGGVITAIIVLSVIGLIKLVFILIAAIKASQGEEYKYPLTIPFVK